MVLDGHRLVVADFLGSPIVEHSDDAIVGTDLCEHAHVGFLAQGRLEGVYADGCTFAYAAPQAVSCGAGQPE